jgi:SAM-dependent methyltransferase
MMDIRQLTATIKPLAGFAPLAVALLLGCGSVAAQDATPKADGSYEPKRGQAGKDVVWIPTPDELVTRMLRLAQVTAQDYVVDLGAGDGKIVIAAARDFGARGLGLEYDPKLVEHAQRHAREAGVSDRADFRQADIFATDFSKADVVTMYLLPNLNLKLRPTLMAMKPGTRLVSHQFTMGDWRPDETSWVQFRPAFLWIVPANVGGKWRAEWQEAGTATGAQLSVEQVFQEVKGGIEFGPIRTSLRSPRLQGSQLQFSFTDERGRVRAVDATASGDQLQGTISGPDGRTAFSATREGLAPPLGEAPASAEEQINAMRQLGE